MGERQSVRPVGPPFHVKHLMEEFIMSTYFERRMAEFKKDLDELCASLDDDLSILDNPSNADPDTEPEEPDAPKPASQAPPLLLPPHSLAKQDEAKKAKRER